MTTKKKSPRLLKGLTLGVVGLGQIGGSMVRCLSRHRDQLILLGYDRDVTVRAKARRFCQWRSSLRAIVEECDLIVLAVPVPSILKLLGDVALLAANRRRRRRLLVVDTGTLKEVVVNAARRHTRHFDFVGLHPFAGSETNGWAGGREGLFTGQTVAYCPSERSGANAGAREFIALLGAKSRKMNPAAHDRHVTMSICLPHAISYAASGLSVSSDGPMVGSWPSLTRVAISDPAMVAGFLGADPDRMRRVLARFQRQLDIITKHLKDNDHAGLKRTLARWRRSEAFHGSA